MWRQRHRLPLQGTSDTPLTSSQLVEGFERAVALIRDRPQSLNRWLAAAEPLPAADVGQYPGLAECLQVSGHDGETDVVVRRLLQRMAGMAAYDEALVIAPGEFAVIPLPPTPRPLTAYRLRLDAPDSHLDDDELQPSATPHLELYVWSDKDTGAPQCWQAPETSPAEHELAWLQSELLPRLAVVVQRADFTSPLQRWRPAAGAELVPLAAHARRYQHLKATYSAQLIERWTEKSMDPQKYLYEEMSLAAYILELFDRAPAADEGAFKHKFVDLGCGNGLLTFFLHAEGYSGWGIDIRARRMWDVYSSRPVLIEEAITPNDATSFDAEWLLGNHSDELTPWLPLLASTHPSGQQKFWVLPCCPFDIDGSRYSRRISDEGPHASYLLHIFQLAENCGLTLHSDVMKIPSTKRVCFVGWPQQPQHASAEAQANRQALFDRGRAFAPRAPQSQHTFQVPRSLQDEVIALVAEALLSRNPAGNTNGWRCGGSMTLGEAAELVGPSRLKQLKTECGGLQTVLRRQHQTFDVHGGTVKIRNWAAAAEERKAKASKPLRWKQRLCWFFLHHPDGCPLQASQCAFAHGEADLRVDDSEAASA